MNSIYKIPGYIYLMGSFFLKLGWSLVREFEGADIWQILFWRSCIFL